MKVFIRKTLVRDEDSSQVRVEITRYKSLIQCFLRFSDKIESDLRSLSGIHDHMCAELIAYLTNCSPKVEQRDRIDKFVSAMALLTTSLGALRLSKLRERLVRSERSLDMIIACMNSRHAARCEKDHYASKLAALRATNTSPDKLERNKIKHQEAEFEFAKIDEKVRNDSQSALETKFDEIDEILNIFVHSLNKVFQPLYSAFKEVSEVPEIASPFAHAPCLTLPVLDDEFKF